MDVSVVDKSSDHKKIRGQSLMGYMIDEVGVMPDDEKSLRGASPSVAHIDEAGYAADNEHPVAPSHIDEASKDA